jgi:tRNA(fMet)-specific endonuclease VapC
LSVLLDTNACIAVMNNRPHVRERLKQARLRREVAFVSTVTLFELWFGIVKSTRRADNANRLSDFLPAVEILEFDDGDARSAAYLRLALARAGTPIGSYDLLIAGQTLHRDLVVVTANVAEFSRVPDLRWENWEV